MSEDPNIIKKAFNKYGPGSINAVKRMAKNAGLSQKAAIEWYQQNGRQKDTVKGKVYATLVALLEELASDYPNNIKIKNRK